MRRFLALICVSTIFTKCAVNNHSFSPDKKYSPEQLQKDFSVYEGVLEEAHPGLYWYTSKDSMDHYFAEARKELKDSLNETGFRKILSSVTSKIGCGHTSIRSSKAYQKYRDTSRIVRIFPLSLKLWNDTAVVVARLNRKDSMLGRGTMITKINGQAISQITQTLFNYIPTDGYNITHKYQVLSNRGSFGSVYSSIYRQYRNFKKCQYYSLLPINRFNWKSGYAGLAAAATSYKKRKKGDGKKLGPSLKN
jgi:hypothetical protein